MFKTLLKQEAMKQSAEPREGDLYREVEVFGKVFDLRYVSWQSALLAAAQRSEDGRRADTVSKECRTCRTIGTWCSECHVLLYFYST